MPNVLSVEAYKSNCYILWPSMDTVNRVVVYKIILSIFISLFLTACGSDSSNALDLTQLEQHKGRANTPSISEV